MDLKESALSVKLILFFTIFFIDSSCNYSKDEEWRCILNCNPGECLILDEEKCECVSEIDCLREKFCGGNVEDCGCTDEDGGIWCTALTEDSIKTWKFAFVYDSIKDYTITTEVFFYLVGKMDFKYTYRLDNIYLEGNQYIEPFIYFWEFDDVYKPTKIIYRYIDSPYYYPKPTHYKELELVKLNQDTLILSYNDDEIAGVIAYVSDKINSGD